MPGCISLQPQAPPPPPPLRDPLALQGRILLPAGHSGELAAVASPLSTSAAGDQGDSALLGLPVTRGEVSQLPDPSNFHRMRTPVGEFV